MGTSKICGFAGEVTTANDIETGHPVSVHILHPTTESTAESPVLRPNNVKVTALSGAEENWQTTSDVHVKDLKAFIASKWGVPVACQRLVMGSALLSDTESIG